MTVRRLENIPGFSIDRVAAAAANDPDVLRLENLDTDLAPPQVAIEVTQKVVTDDDANSYLPFTGSLALRECVAQRLRKQSSQPYSLEQVVITAGGTEGMFDALLATTDPGDEVILTDPTYAGMIYRVRLAGAIPKLVPLFVINNEWRLDLEALRAAAGERTRALFIMSPSMPSGAVLNEHEWNTIAGICQERSAWLIYNAAMERILFDGFRLIHPAALPAMAERTITVGSVSKEYRMIGWRTGWVVGPQAIINDIARVHIYNVVTATGIAQSAACAALQSPDEDFAACLVEWQKRHEVVVEQLRGMPIIPAAGGWSLLLNVCEMGYDSMTASRLLLERGKVAATPMKYWGDRNSDQFIRLVFSNEPVERLESLRERVTQSL